MLINADKVRDLFEDTLWKKGEGEGIEVVGLVSQHTLSLEKLEAHRPQIGEAIANLKPEMTDNRSGAEYLSITSAHYDRNGSRWTTDDWAVEKVIMLGIASELLLRLAVPEAVESHFFPGGRPIYLIKA